MPFQKIQASCTVVAGKIISKDSKPVSSSPKSKADQLVRLRLIFDRNGGQHLVYSLQTYFNPPETRICFVETPGHYAMVQTSCLLQLPSSIQASLDPASINRWWDKCVIPFDQRNRGYPYFPVPLFAYEGFRVGEHVTVCIPDIPPLNAVVKSVAYFNGSSKPRQYKVIYSDDSPYDSGIIKASEVFGPGIAFNPQTPPGSPRRATLEPASPVEQYQLFSNRRAFRPTTLSPEALF
jgi:hypothetical protein